MGDYSICTLCIDWNLKDGNVLHVGKKWRHYKYSMAIENYEIYGWKFLLGSERVLKDRVIVSIMWCMSN